MLGPYAQVLKDSRAALKRVALLLLSLALLFSWTSPNHYYPWTTFHAQFAAALSAAMLGWMVLLDQRPAKVHLPYLTCVAAAAACVPWLQFSFGIIYFLGDALVASLFLLAFAFAQVVGFRLALAQGLKSVMEPLSWLFVTGALLSVWLALYQWQGHQYLFVFAIELGPGQLPFANFAQPNQLGTMLVLGIVGCAYLYSAQRLGASTSFLVMAMLAFGVAMTGSRAALLEIMCVAVWLAFSLRRISGPINLKSITVVCALVAISIWAWPQLQFEGESRARAIESVQSVGTRPTHWMSMLDAATQAPWVGHGWNQVSAAQFAVAQSYPATFETLAESHNLFIDLLVWNGFPVGLLLSLALIAWFAVVLRQRQTSASAIAMAAVIAPFAHAMVEFPLHYLYFLLPTAVVMGAVTAELRPKSSLVAPKWTVIGAFAGVCIAGMAMSLEYMKIEAAMRASRFEAARIRLDRPRPPPVEATLLTQHAALIQFARTPEREGMTPTELTLMKHVVLRYPHSTFIVRYASALAKNGRPAEAIAALTRICKIGTPKECSDARSTWAMLAAYHVKTAAVAFPEFPTP